MEKTMNQDEWAQTYRWQEHGTKLFPADFKFLWPAQDESLHGDIPTINDLDTDIFPLIAEKGVAVQAGGAMGMWAKRMAQVFQFVYTFEPTPQSFHCLSVNVPEENVIKINAALGHERKLVKMGFPEHRARSQAKKDNYGGFRCLDGGHVPTLLLDDLNLPRCDLLMLDLEGYELFALQGAIETIKRCHPVIVMEDKGCSKTFGYEKGKVEQYLARHAQYKTLKRFHGGRDVVCVPQGFAAP
jgi:FkbM family methyltransferase